MREKRKQGKDEDGEEYREIYEMKKREEKERD